MDGEARTKLWLEPSALWWHYRVRVRNIHQLLDEHRIQAERNPCRPIADLFLQKPGSPYATDELDAFVCARIANSENGGEDAVLEEADIE